MSPRLTASSHSRRSPFSSCGLGELLDRRFVAAVERLLDQLAAALRPAGQRHALLVQVVVAGGVGAGNAELDHQPAQFRARKAGADDRAMHAVVHVVDRRAPLGDRRHEFTGRRLAAGHLGGRAHLHRNHAVRKRRRGAAGRKDARQHIRGARRHLRYIQLDTTVVAHIGGLEKRGLEEPRPKPSDARGRTRALAAARARRRRFG